MIYRDEMLPLLVSACPSFLENWEEHKREYRDEENYLPYIAIGEFSHHLVELYKSKKTKEFPAVFTEIERFHIEGEAYVKEAATIGCLEGLQNVAENRGLDANVFLQYLGPESTRCWKELNKFWNGEIGQTSETVDK